MDEDIVIKVEGVSKKFVRSIRRSMAYGAVDLTRDFFGIQYDVRKLRKGEFWSLRNINFEVKKGESFGLVGANGSGKSTLLRLINGIFPPDEGRITVRGRMGALIAVGAGFHPHMSGRQNIYVNGAILGMSRAEIDEKFQSIVEFADIGEFLDAPVSTYSSGMYVRLGFAIAIHSRPDIMLVDEVLAVGDAQFQRKCLNKINEMRQDGVTFFIVSHNMQNIQAMCDRAVLLNKGEQIAVGTVADIVSSYELLMQGGDIQAALAEKHPEPKYTGELSLVNEYIGFGTKEIEVKTMKWVDDEGNLVSHLKYPQPIHLDAELRTNQALKGVVLKYSFILVNLPDPAQDHLVSAGGEIQNIDLVEGANQLRLTFNNLDLTTGVYKLSFHLYDESVTTPYSNGHYGMFQSLGTQPNIASPGTSTPLVLLHPEISLS